MTARAAALALASCALLAGAPAFGAAAPAKEKQKAPAAKAPAKAAPDKAKGPDAEPAKAAGDDADVASAGKIIEFDGSGNAKVVKGQATPTDPDQPPITVAGEDLPGAQADKPAGSATAKPGADPGFGAADGCKIRFKAQCAFLSHCAGGALPLDCDQMMVVCENLSGPAAYAKKDAEACAAGIKALSCSAVESMGLAFDPEAKVPACKAVRDAEQGEQPAKPKAGGKAPPKVPGAGADFRDLDVDLGGVLGGGTE